ncbi:hypothetical protein BCR33DRAFT_712639 [Rhizoclosmatium globosum]|uniref:Fucolectin tachylectin-4 pentraxin-1 domain-containing protein n=1 Tax=Rhizoclosmatium globosum TaxID=329046 RepID=A0A1Y2CX53_9FUNG|nr:hypothetical protein BCR33DRAFT_712639 [Rhizoclosmatium globosum]|eukprot:ORY51612.1 hypothetical protein BCR33DRAFT_712639 [Rhizoclosmatium globosum]
MNIFASLILFAVSTSAVDPYTNVTIECNSMPYFEFAEIEIFEANGTNIALQGEATMSSVHGGLDASRCIDGNYDSACYTADSPPYQWMNVRVPVPATSITTIKLWQVWNNEFWPGCWLTVYDSEKGAVQKDALHPQMGPSIITNTCPWIFTMNYDSDTTVKLSSCPRGVSFKKLEVYNTNGTNVASSGYAEFDTAGRNSVDALNCLFGYDPKGVPIRCQQTEGETDAWWKAVVPNDYRTLTNLTLYPRLDDGAWHFSGCLLTVTARIGSTQIPLLSTRIPDPPNGDLTVPYTFDIPKPTTMLNVACVGTSPLALAEIEVFTADGVNIAGQGTVRATSIVSGTPTNEIDGDYSTTLITAANDNYPRISLSLPLPSAIISTVKIWKAAKSNIGNGCFVTISDSISGIVQQRNLQQLSSDTPTAYNLTINYVNSTTVKLSCPRAVLGFNLLEVFDTTGTNVALNSYATSSSAYIANAGDTDSFPAFNCLDGKDLCGNQLFCLTGKNDTSPWWKTVITNDVNSLTSVKIYPRDGDATLAGCSLLVQGSQYNVAKLNVTLPVMALGNPYIFNF